MRVSLIVVNFNGRRYLEKLLWGIGRQSWRDFELIFIDNASHDDSVAYVQAAGRGLELVVIQNPANLGFAAACNQGAKEARGEWLALLNNDAWPEPTWLKCMLTTAEEHPGLGMVASKLLFAHEPERINSCGIALDWAGIAWDWRGGEPDTPHETQETEIFGPCAGGALYSRALFLELGGFDEDYFAYLEDVDFAWRARLAGQRCLLAPEARIYHYHSATLGNTSPFKKYLLARNKTWTIVKNYPQPWLIRCLPAIIAYDLLSIPYRVVRTGDIASLKGRLAGLRTVRAALAKRRQVQSRWRDVENWRRAVQPLVPPWAVRRRYAHLKA